VIVITGPGRSGTSFMADLYRNLGFDPGGGWEDDKRAGLEERDVVKMNTKLCEELGAPIGPPPRTALGKQRWDRVAELADKHGKKLRKLAESRDVVKDPRFCWTLRVWVAAGAPISHIVLTLRKVEDVIGSAAHAGMRKPVDEVSSEQLNDARSTVTYRIGAVLTAAAESGLPYSTLWFPGYLSDPEGLYGSLSFPKPVSLDAFMEGFRKTVKPEFVNFGDRPE
jgi:hypothetical protein